MKMATTKPYILAATLSKAIANKNNIKTSSAAGNLLQKILKMFFFQWAVDKKAKDGPTRVKMLFLRII